MTLREYDARNRKFDRAQKNLDATFDIPNPKRRMSAFARRANQMLALLEEMIQQDRQRTRELLRRKKRPATRQ